MTEVEIEQSNVRFSETGNDAAVYFWGAVSFASLGHSVTKLPLQIKNDGRAETAATTT